MVVLVIGGGASGLAALKCLQDEGLEGVCYEAEEALGGLWRFTDHESHSSVYRSTVINTSKEMMCFSDFPIPPHYPPFMSHEMIIEYFNQYADHFRLKERIVFNTRVESVQKISPSKFSVISFNSKSGERKTEEFQAVMVCSGHHWKPNVVPFKSQELFGGKVIHSHGYKDHRGYEGKNVLVVGIGNSGVDVAVELSRFAKKVYLSTRSGTWLANRMFNGVPGDFLVNTRLGYFLPFAVREAVSSQLLQQMNGRIEEFGLKPTHSPLGAHPTINGELIGRIAVGSVVVKPNIREFTGRDSVSFEDGTDVTELDAVILCTGYEIEFPFIDPATTGFKVTNNEVQLYKYIFLPPPKDQPKIQAEGGLSFIGLIQPWGAIMPISEIQSRWVARILAGKQQLPTSRDIWRDIEAKKVEMKHRYKESKRHTIQVDYVTYMDEISKEIGAYPDFWRIFFQYSPLLALKIIFGPGIPPVYRLLGPGKWNGASTVINHLWERNFFPTRTRTIQDANKGGLTLGRKVIILIILLIVFRLLRGGR